MFGLFKPKVPTITMAEHVRIVAVWRDKWLTTAIERDQAESSLATFRAARAKQHANLTQNRKAAKGAVS